MKAFILAAGLGSRLKPLTDELPKALVDVGGMSMLERLINRFVSIGITEILINVYHHSDLIINFVEENKWPNINISISDESGQLLDTGGAIVHAKDFFRGSENILVHNVDILSDINFQIVEKFHKNNNNLVTLCVRDRNTSRKLIFNLENKLIGWTNTTTNEFKWVNNTTEFQKSLAYSGVYIASPEFASKITAKGKFSIIDTWLELAKTEKIFAYEDNDSNWFDLGSVERINVATQFLKERESSEKFLVKIADELSLLGNKELIDTIVILPNKRSIVFLKKHLCSGRVNSVWLPEMLSIDEYMQKISEFALADPLKLFFNLFHIYKEIFGSNTRSFSDFIAWAPMIIRDFNDIDLHLANAEDVLKHISEARAIKEWNLDGSELTEMQLAYIKFYQALFPMYEQLHLKMKSENIAYAGFIYRYISDNLETLIEQLKWKNYVFAGFSALSKSEEKIFAYIKDNRNTKIYLDADEYYINEKDFDLATQEAGKNIKQLIENWKLPEFKYLTNRLVNSTKKIKLYAVQSPLSQVKLAASLILNNEENYADSETAIVLADENLLIPLINSLPDKQAKSKKSINYNVTLGYPLTYSPLKGFIYDWLHLLIEYQQDGNKQFRSRNLIKIFFSNVLISCLDKQQQSEIKKVSNYFITNNISFIEIKELVELINANAESLNTIAKILFSEPTNSESVNNSIIEILLLLDEKLDENSPKNIILKEQINLFLGVSKRFELNATGNFENIDLQTFSNLYFQLASNYSINLKGEPLSGIQIMGMLETRALDFKNLIIISANEGILPKAAMPDSFIPFDIRRNYGLPLPQDKNSVMAYHFFRLLQYSKNISLIYDESSEGLGVGEPSRFIRQIELELSKLNNKIEVKKHLLNIEGNVNSSEIIINKNDKILHLLHEKAKKGYSPSALNAFISCSLKFYFQYILKIKKEEQIEASVESNTFGSIIHDALEEIYKPYVGKVIQVDGLKQSLKNLDKILLKYFEKHYNTKNIMFGQNYLIWKVSKQYMQNFIKSEISVLKKDTVEIIGLEQNKSYVLSTDSGDINLYGIIDRVDKPSSTGIQRIVDYKTGKVEQANLSPKIIEDLIEKTEYAKAFQVLFYKFIYQKSEGINTDLESGIISLRNLRSGFMKFGIKDYEGDIITDFGNLLNTLFAEIYNRDSSFKQTDDTKVCEYCDFKNICKR